MQKFFPRMMNIELTTACPLRCPQCYCSLANGKHIELQTALHWIQEGGANGVKDVMLSGGETLCYPHIYEVISAANKWCGYAHIALSGFGFTKNIFDKLVNSGVCGIFISLNGSTEEINAQTRDGYYLALSALQLLHKYGFQNTYINWVMHSCNSDDFINVVEIAEKYEVRRLVVMALKPDSNNKVPTMPTEEQMLDIKRVINNHKGNVQIMVESCYSPMIALLKNTKLLGNLNTSAWKGCGAGRYTFSVSVDGMLSPCRHLNYYEEYSSLSYYWNNSKVLQYIREIEDNKREPCKSCDFSEYCRHCLAINYKANADLYIGHEACPLKSCQLKDVV